MTVKPPLSLADTVTAIRRELEASDRLFAFRLLARAATAMDDGSIDVPASPLPSTGDVRWDTLLLALVQRTCQMRHLIQPDWARPKRRAEPWYIDETPALRHWTRKRTPADLASLNIFVDANSLTTA